MAKYKVDWFVDSFDKDTHMGYDEIDADSFDDAQFYADEHCGRYEYVITEMEDDTMMTMTRFIDEVIAEVKMTFPGYDIVAVDVKKPNEGVLTGIQVKQPDSDVAPVFYANDLFKAYACGDVSFESAVDSLVSNIEGWVVNYGDEPKNKFDMDFSFENICDKLSIRVMDANKNADYLDTVPHVNVGNGLAVVFVVNFSKDDNGIYQAVITNEMSSNLDIDADALYDAALNSASKFDPAVLFSMGDAVLGGSVNLLDKSEVDSSEPMFVLTTATQIHGASALFYPGIQDRIADILGCGYYVLPSSVHEVLIIPESGDIDAEALKAMLTTGNETVTEQRDVLSNCIYKFDRSEAVTTEHFYIAA